MYRFWENLLTDRHMDKTIHALDDPCVIYDIAYEGV